MNSPIVPCTIKPAAMPSNPARDTGLESASSDPLKLPATLTIASAASTNWIAVCGSSPTNRSSGW